MTHSIGQNKMDDRWLRNRLLSLAAVMLIISFCFTQYFSNNYDPRNISGLVDLYNTLPQSINSVEQIDSFVGEKRRISFLMNSHFPHNNSRLINSIEELDEILTAPNLIEKVKYEHSYKRETLFALDFYWLPGLICALSIRLAALLLIFGFMF